MKSGAGEENPPLLEFQNSDSSFGFPFSLSSWKNLDGEAVWWGADGYDTVSVGNVGNVPVFPFPTHQAPGGTCLTHREGEDDIRA